MISTSVASYQYKLIEDNVEGMTMDSPTLPSVHVASSIIPSITMATQPQGQTFRYSLNLFMNEMKNSAFLMLPGMASIEGINVNHFMKWGVQPHPTVFHNYINYNY